LILDAMVAIAEPGICCISVGHERCLRQETDTRSGHQQRREAIKTDRTISDFLAKIWCPLWCPSGSRLNVIWRDDKGPQLLNISYIESIGYANRCNAVQGYEEWQTSQFGGAVAARARFGSSISLPARSDVPDRRI
jgi:hypothetical protein